MTLLFAMSLVIVVAATVVIGYWCDKELVGGFIKDVFGKLPGPSGGTDNL